jgi:hypothetical protein
MRSAVWNRIFFTLCLAPALAACMTSPAQRHIGPSPVIDADAVEQSSGRIDRVMTALARDAGGGSMYDVTEAGFNYVDDRCIEYFSELFYLNRRREAAKSGFGAFNQTTNAILTATGASSLSMGIVAQAFGLAQNLTDIVAGTYLYQLPPATTLSFVKKLQGAYRDAAFAKRGQVQTQATAYHLIQDYLSLCLPPVIEAELVKHVADAAASPVRGGSAANIEIKVASETSAPVRREVVEVIERPDTPLPKVTERPAAKNSINSFEAKMSEHDIKVIQQTLCLSPANGELDETTRIAVDELFRGIKAQGNPKSFPSARQGGIRGEHMKKLREAKDQVNGVCNPDEDVSAFEIGRTIP